MKFSKISFFIGCKLFLDAYYLFLGIRIPLGWIPGWVDVYRVGHPPEDSQEPCHS